MGSETLVSPNINGIKESSLEDIEEAYLELVKAYSACLAYIIIEKHYHLHFMGSSNYYEENEKTREYATCDISVYNGSRKKRWRRFK